MCGIMLCMSAALLGADAGSVGWGPSPADNVFQYVIQIAPDKVGQLNSGSAIDCDIPPQLKGIRRIRITVGTGNLEQVTPPEPPAQTSPAEAARSADRPPSGALSQTGSSPWMPRGASPEQPLEKPRTLTPPRDSKPLPTKQAAYVSDEGSESSQAKSIARKKDEKKEDAPNPQAPKPWMALTLTVVALCGSLGGNAYLVWIAMDSRRRCRELLHCPQGQTQPLVGWMGEQETD
jgi:hypothetical protein